MYEIHSGDKALIDYLLSVFIDPSNIHTLERDSDSAFLLVLPVLYTPITSHTGRNIFFPLLSVDLSPCFPTTYKGLCPSVSDPKFVPVTTKMISSLPLPDLDIEAISEICG